MDTISLAEEFMNEIRNIVKESPERIRQNGGALLSRIEENLRYNRVKIVDVGRPMRPMVPGEWVQRPTKGHSSCGNCGEYIEPGTVAWITQGQSPRCTSCGKPSTSDQAGL